MTGSAATDWLKQAQAAASAVDGLYRDAMEGVRKLASKDGKLSAALLEREQHAAHGLAWLATYLQAINEMIHYAERMIAAGKFGETESLLTQISRRKKIPQVSSALR